MPGRHRRISIEQQFIARQPLLPYSNGQFERHRLSDFTYICQHCNALHWLEEKTSSSSITNPQFPNCCHGGKVLLPSRDPPPEPLLSLFNPTIHNEFSTHFLDNIRAYNNAFSYSSCGAKIDESMLGQRGVYTFRIQGQLYHLIGALLPQPHDVPKFAQIYLYDGDEQQVQFRMSHFPEDHLNPLIMSALQRMFQNFNPYAITFKNAGQRMRATPNNLQPIQLKISTTHNHTINDHRRYNRPTANEVAVILPGADDNVETGPRDIILEQHNGGFKRISELHSGYLPLRYPIFFPFAEQGWFPYFRSMTENPENPRKVTQLQYYAFLFQIRQNQINTILFGRRLFQEFIVDAYAQIENSRLNWIRFNQGTLRAEQYQGFADAIDAGSNLNQIGCPTVLPSSFIGGPRQMTQLYHDAMAIVRATGKPDLFITMTCNPKWPEILQQCQQNNQTAQDRPDIVARVFKCKLQALLYDLIHNNILGRPVAHLHVIEFQKRGLPHAHILLILYPQDKPSTSDIIDQIVSAEIPDPMAYPLLYESVISHMFHGPCGRLNTAATCMKKSGGAYCDRRYPRPFNNYTSLQDDGYPLYRRRNNGISVEKHGFIFTNQHVVPYNPYLLQKYDCHINVEIATSITAVKYLYKYIYKGHDRTSLSIERDNHTPRDEVKDFLDSRYISACESIWRIFSFPLHSTYPAVTRLHLHLPDMQTVQFDPNNDTPDDILQNPQNKETTLTKFFELCSLYPMETATLLYPDCPRYYTWKKAILTWSKRRNQSNAVGRVYFAPPSAGERYYLRMLLYNVPSPKSFEYLRTYQDELYDTFQAACAARGLLASDEEWDNCLQEAAEFKTGHQLRVLFVTILVMNEPQDPASLFERHLHTLSDDCRVTLQRRFHIDMPTVEQICSYCLSNVQDLLEKSGKSLEDYNLPLPTIQFEDLDGVPRIIAQQLNYDHMALQQHWETGYGLANEEQRKVLDAIVNCLERNEQGLFFIDGPGGTGKTFVENLLLAYVRSKGGIALAVASSGIAALLLQGGRTSHSQFKIPLDIHGESQCNISAQSHLATLIRMTKLIIWDEAPSQHRHCFQAVDRSFKDIHQSNDWFGGIPMVFGGDFRQCLPVVPNATFNQILDSTLPNASFWKDVQVFHLTTNMRLLARVAEMSLLEQEKAIAFAVWLLEIGNGKVEIMNEDGTTTLPTQFCLPTLSDNWNLNAEYDDRLTSYIYPSLSEVLEWSDEQRRQYFSERVILSARNFDVDKENESILERFPGELKEYLSSDSACQDGGIQDDSIPMEYLNTITIPGMPLHKTCVKVGCPIILLRNLDHSSGLCNGTRMIVTNAAERVIEAKILTGSHTGETVFVPRVSLDSNQSSTKLPFTLKRRQFPIRIAFAMTINKSQGQSLQIVGLKLCEQVFAHGQLYVALSRCMDYRSLYISLKNDNIERNVDNIVYQQVLRN